MKLFPLVAFTNFIVFVILVVLTFRLWLSYRKRKGEFLKYFFVGFLSLTLYFFCLATPGFLIKNVLLFTLTHFWSQFFLHIAAFSFLVIALRSIGWKTGEKIFCFLLASSMIFYEVVGLWKFSPPKFLIQEKFFVWTSFTHIPYLKAEQGIVIGICALLTGILFFLNGLRSYSPFVRKRSIILGSGMILFVAAAFINYIGGRMPIFWIYPLASGISILASSVMLYGAILKKEKE